MKIQHEIEDLEIEKREKLAKAQELDEVIGNLASRIDYHGVLNANNLQLVYENRIHELNEILSKKAQLYS